MRKYETTTETVTTENRTAENRTTKNALKKNAAKTNVVYKKLDTDLWIIALTSMIVFMAYGAYSKEIMSFIKNSTISVWSRLGLAAAMEYGIAGLGITIVCLFRKESFVSYGLKKENSLRTILATILVFIPFIAFIILSGQFEGYHPLSVMVSDDLHKAGLLSTILGTGIIGVVWGFFEGFNYVVIAEKVNRRYPTNFRFFDWGTLVCAIMCVFFHPFSTSLLGLIEIAVNFIAIYGMLQIYKKYQNAWGCVFAFIFIWNAF